MRYKELFERLEKKNPTKAYWIDMCRRDNLSFLDVPLWIGMITGITGIFISKINSVWSMILTGGWGLFAVAIIFYAVTHETYKDKLEKELR